MSRVIRVSSRSVRPRRSSSCPVLGFPLRKRGINSEIYEQADELREIGAEVALSANGTRELRRPGVG